MYELLRQRGGVTLSLVLLNLAQFPRPTAVLPVTTLTAHLLTLHNQFLDLYTTGMGGERQ